MSEKISLPRVISEHLIEIRYNPNPKILDYRGTWAEAVSRLMQLSEWRIDANRVDVSDKENIRRVFVSFKNAGMVINNSSNRNFLPGQSGKFLRFLFDQEAFGQKIFIKRIGVRGRFATAFGGEYKELLDLYTSRFVSLTDEAINALDAEVIDFGGPINFSTKIGNLNSMSGPMPKKQLQHFFSSIKIDKLPEIAFYLDLDYWKRPEKEMNGREITDLTKRYAEEIWDIHERIQTLVLSS